MPRRRTNSLPIHGDVPKRALSSMNQVEMPTVPRHAAGVSEAASAQSAQLAWKPPRKEETHLDDDAIEDPRGGPRVLDELMLNVLSKTDHFLVLNKNPDVRLDGDFNVTIEKAMHRDFPEVEKFRWIHQLDFATSGVMCVGLTKESTANASALFAKKSVEKEYLALVQGTMPFTPPPNHKCVTYSRLSDFIHDKDNFKTKKQHEHKFTKQFKGPRTGPSLFAMDQGAIRRKHAQEGRTPTPDEAEFLRKKWNDLPDDIQKAYLERAAKDKLRFEAQLKELECRELPQVRYDIPIQKAKHASTSQRPRAMSDMSLPEQKRCRVLNTVDEPMGYVFDDAIAESATNTFQMEISNNGKVSTTIAFVLGHGFLDGQPVSKVLLRPLSGRRHQLRLHLSHYGYPIVGDVTYGSEDDMAPRMMLHAWKLLLKFPSDQQQLYGNTFYESPDPFDDIVKTSVSVSTIGKKTYLR